MEQTSSNRGRQQTKTVPNTGRQGNRNTEAETEWHAVTEKRETEIARTQGMRQTNWQANLHRKSFKKRKKKEGEQERGGGEKEEEGRRRKRKRRGEGGGRGGGGGEEQQQQVQVEEQEQEEQEQEEGEIS